MWNLWNDYDRTFSALDELRRRMDYVFGDLERGVDRGARGMLATREWPRTVIQDEGEQLVLQALVPGVDEADLEMTATADTITLSGERISEMPEGYSVHRQERGSIKFARSFTLPTKIDPEQIEASCENGVLTVRLGKAAESRPRQISVKASVKASSAKATGSGGKEESNG